MTRRELRSWRSLWTTHLLEKFKNTKFLQKIKTDPIKSHACPVEANDFADFLQSIFQFETPITDDIDEELLLQIKPMTLQELEKALTSLSNLRCADNDGLVAEMLKFGNQDLKIEILRNFNESILLGKFEGSWHSTIFQMLSKEGNLKLAAN